MDRPPPLPGPEPLGNKFYVLLMAPIVGLALSVVITKSGGPNNAGDWGIPLSFLALLAMLVCSIICAVMIGKRKGGWLGFLAFIGIQVIYVAVAFAGCGYMMEGMSFH